MRKIFIVIICVLLFPKPHYGSDDFQYWSWLTAKAVDTEKVDINLHAQIRYRDDASQTALYLISPRLSLDFFRNLNFGINYTHLQVRKTNASTGATNYLYQHRYELEANPHWDIKKIAKIKNRNRVEFREIENSGSDHTRFRHLWSVGFPKWHLSSSAEFFYDFKASEYNENRIMPIGLDFDIFKKVNFQVFYMAQSVKTNNWSTNQILGTHLKVSF